MAQNQNNKNSKGMCEKIYSAVSGGRKLRLISDHAQGSAPSKAAKSRVQNTDNPTKPSHRMIPVEFEPSIRPSPMSQKENIQTTAKNAGKDNGTKRVSEISARESVTNGESHHLKGKTKLKERMASMAMIKPRKDKAAVQEKGDAVKKIEPKKTIDKFSDYIDHVKKKMNVSTVGGGGGGGGGGGAGGDGGAGVGRTATRRDSFNNRVSSYIKHTKMKIRMTTNFDGKSTTFK